MVGYSGNGAQRRSCRQLGSSAFIPSESKSLFGLRRSLRLRSKPAMTMSVEQSRKRRNSRNPKPKRPLLWPQPGEIICRGGLLAMPRILRKMRQIPACYFRNAYSYCDPTSDEWDKIIEKRFIVASGREHVFPNVGRSHGIRWIGVHGINSISAVFLNEKPVMQRIIDRQGDKFLTNFMKYVLSEMEDIADSYSNETRGRPFAVVSFPNYRMEKESCRAAPDPSIEAHGKPLEYLTPSIEAQGKAVEYLKTKMQYHPAFSRRQSQLIAISAFQHLCQQKLTAKDVMVCYFMEDEDNDFEIKMLSTAKKKQRLARLESAEGEYDQATSHQTLAFTKII